MILTNPIRPSTVGNMPALVVHTLDRRAAQRAVGRVPLNDVLRSLQRQRIIVHFRVKPTVVVVEAERVLGFFFEGVLTGGDEA